MAKRLPNGDNRGYVAGAPVLTAQDLSMTNDYARGERANMDGALRDPRRSPEWLRGWDAFQPTRAAWEALNHDQAYCETEPDEWEE